MNVVFTICSNNYTAHAATLMQSWFQYHPETLGYVILVDELSDKVDYKILAPATVVDLASFDITSLDRLIEAYNITELNTAVKPDVFLYLFQKHPNSKIVYLDPDILVTGTFTHVFKALDENDFVLTPHICQPIDDKKGPTDYHTLGTGIFNLGFIALKNSDQIQRFLHWWRERVLKYGYCNLPANMFYDQLWANYIPVLFDKYHILKHPGYNMANWNLHERIISLDNQGEWKVNGTFDLKFFHFSGYKFTQPENISINQDRFDFNTRPDLKPIFNVYQKKLLQNGVQKLTTIPCVYYEQHLKIKEDKRLAEQQAIPARIKVIRKFTSIVRRLIYN